MIPVETRVVRVSVVVVDGELDQAPPLLGGGVQHEGLHGVARGGVGEVEQRRHGGGHRVLGHPGQGQLGRRGVDVTVRGEQAGDVLWRGEIL